MGHVSNPVSVVALFRVQDELSATHNAQPAILTYSLAVAHVYEVRNTMTMWNLPVCLDRCGHTQVMQWLLVFL